MYWIIDYIKNFWAVFSAMSPWLLTGYLLAGVISVILAPGQVKKHLSGKGFLPVLKAVLLGVPLPLCSCGVIPVAASLRDEGADKGATGAFFIATPQTGIDSIIVTWSMMGWQLAVLRPIAAFLSGLAGGLLIKKFCKADPAPVSTPEPEKKTCCCCKTHRNASTEKRGFLQIIHAIFSYGFTRMMKSTAPSLLTGMIIAALIQQLIPEDFGIRYFHGNPVLEFAAVTALAIPLYVCSSASVPIAAALILKGFSPGAALVFLIAGPAIHSVSITAMKSLLGTAAAVCSIISVGFFALAAGITVNLLDISFTLPEFFEKSSFAVIRANVCGILLALVVIRAMILRHKEKITKKS